MQILRIDMSSLTASYEDIPEDWKVIGGRYLSAKILNAEVPPNADPLGPDARLVFANGPLAGTNGTFIWTHVYWRQKPVNHGH